jgi:cyclopropane-fatty-acyl-phospholipid synthase
MKAVTRNLSFPPELLLYGPSYAYLQYLIRSPQPLDPEWVWNEVAKEPPPHLRWFVHNYPPRFVRRLILAAKIRQDHLTGIAYHYDVSNDFYKLFLDDRFMFYTCADFHSPNETIEEAQQHKADYILDLIDPEPGEKILDLGCGWGSMMKRIAQHTGSHDDLYGYTLSEAQVAYVKERYGYNVEFRNFVTTDYPQEFFDKVYSIGSWEAVRPHELLPTLQKIYASMKPGGRLVKHFFCRGEAGLFASIACGQIFFPGHLGAPYRVHLDAFEQAGFVVRQRSIHDYRPTLRAWFDRLADNREAALKIVDVSTLNRYLVFFPASWRYFQEGRGMVIRWVMEKPVVPGRKTSS